jgi:hypothetical protein
MAHAVEKRRFRRRKMNKKQKHWSEMNARELAQATKQFDKEFSARDGSRWALRTRR